MMDSNSEPPAVNRGSEGDRLNSGHHSSLDVADATWQRYDPPQQACRYCPKAVHAREVCSTHYSEWWRQQRPQALGENQ